MLENLNDKTFNNISAQLEAASYNITIFSFLFAIAAIILGIYVTKIENKVVRIKEETDKLLVETKKNKEEVVSINNLIQKDINGLYLKIKREETCYMLNRLVLVPKDIANLSYQLFSREVEKGDFEVLKKAYIKLMQLPEEQRESYGLGASFESDYLMIFFQHFLDLSVKDEIIGKDMIRFYSQGINCSFENDIVKSTTDFMSALVETGYKTKENEINCYMKGLSGSIYKNTEDVYKIFFDKLQNRNNQFGFFMLIEDSIECRIGKSNYGKLLISSYSNTELNDEEKAAIAKTNEIIAIISKEDQERNEVVEQQRKEKA